MVLTEAEKAAILASFEQDVRSIPGLDAAVIEAYQHVVGQGLDRRSTVAWAESSPEHPGAFELSYLSHRQVVKALGSLKKSGPLGRPTKQLLQSQRSSSRVCVMFLLMIDGRAKVVLVYVAILS